MENVNSITHNRTRGHVLFNAGGGNPVGPPINMSFIWTNTPQKEIASQHETLQTRQQSTRRLSFHSVELNGVTRSLLYRGGWVLFGTILIWLEELGSFCLNVVIRSENKSNKNKRLQREQAAEGADLPSVQLAH